MAQPDLQRIKSNVAKMIDQGAPEGDIDAYVAAEGTTPEALRGAGKADTSYVGAVQQGLSDVVSGVGKTVKDYVSPDTGSAIETKGAKVAPKNYQSATEDFMNRDGAWYDKNWSSAPRAVVENAPALATDVLAGLVGAKLGGKAGAAVGSGLSYLLRTRGEAAESRARNRTGDENATPSTEDKVIAGAAGIPEAALASVGASRFVNPARVASTGLKGAVEATGNLAKTAAIEGGVGAGQNVIGQVADTAGTPGGTNVDPGQVFGAGALSAGTGAGMGSVRLASDVNNARRFRDFDGEAAKRVATRIQDNADGDLGNVKTARKAVGAAETDIKSDLTNAFSTDADLKSKIDANDGARRALARLNSDEQVTPADITNIAKVADGTAAGDRVSSLVGELTALRKLRAMGAYSGESFKGGVSNQMERGVRAIYNPVGALTGAGLAAAGLSQPALAAGMLSSAPHAVAAAMAGYAGARALDRATGYRSPAKTFVDKFGGTGAATPGVNQPAPPARVGPTGPAIAQAPTFNGRPTTPPFGTTPALTPQDLAARGNRLDAGIRRVAQANAIANRKADEAQTASIDSGADMIGRNAIAQVRAQRRIEAMRQRQQAYAERQALQELKSDATGLVQSRTATLKTQQQDAQQTAQAKRANDALERRGITEQSRDARELMASRKSVTPADREQMFDASNLVAARRANEAAQRAQEQADAPAPEPDPIKASRDLLKSLAAVQKVKAKAAKQESPAIAAAKATAKANGKVNGHDTAAPKSLADYPEAPWAYETPAKAAQMAHDYAERNGTAITNPEGYKRGAAKRIEATRDAFAAISKEVPKSDLAVVEDALNRMLAVRSESDAKNFRTALKSTLPHADSVIDKHLSDAWIRQTWTPQRSKLH